MKRIGIIVLSIISLICGVSNAESVSRKDAQRFASAFFNEANGRVMAQPKEVVFGRGLTTDRLFTPFYIFNHPKGGFIIISAENKTFPILAFSLTDKFDSSRIDPEIQAILTTYARDIENIRYDSSIPTQAIESWIDYSGYIDDILKSIKGTHEYEKVIFKENVQSLIDSIADLEDNYRFSCELFSPDQWKEIVFGEIKEKGSLPLGFRNIKGNFIGVWGKGFSGDYLMIENPSFANSYFRLNASEILSDGILSNIENFIPDPPEEQPFTFYENYINQISQEKKKLIDKYSKNQYPETPSVAYNGAGHFNIFIPEGIKTVTVYNITGAKIGYYKFKDTNNANIDLSIQPNGFYFAQAIGEKGNKYGFKLLR